MFKNKLWFLVGVGLVASSAALGGLMVPVQGVKNDLLCVAIEGADSQHKSALAVLRVKKNGQTQGVLCYLASLQDTELADCHLVAGRVLTAPVAAKASYMGLVGTGIDKDQLIQNDVAVTFLPAEETGKGAAIEFTVSPPGHQPTPNDTGVGKAYQGACKYDPQAKMVKAHWSMAPENFVWGFNVQRILPYIEATAASSPR